MFPALRRFVLFPFTIVYIIIGAILLFLPSPIASSIVPSAFTSFRIQGLLSISHTIFYLSQRQSSSHRLPDFGVFILVTCTAILSSLLLSLARSPGFQPLIGIWMAFNLFCLLGLAGYGQKMVPFRYIFAEG